MDIKISPSTLKGKVKIPASKSYVHRMLICAALSSGISEIKDISFSKDISATISSLTELGADFETYKKFFKAFGNQIKFGIYNMYGLNKDKLKDFYDRDENFRNIINSSDKLMLLYEISTLIEGFPRHISTHAAGVVMSRIDLDRIIPLVRNNDMYISGYTMEYLEELGLLKMDFLGIKNLTTIMNIIADIESSLGIKINFSDIPLDDPDALKLFETADTCGIFQFESEGMKNFLRKLRPNTIYDIFAAIALFRPGPAVNIDSYIRRKHGLEQVTYLDPCLEGILSSTYGIIIYQEQIMQIANVMAGFSYGEADILRRAMSKKKLDLLKGEEIRFIEGSVTRGHKEEDAKRVFDLILNFANYGFNKAHSISYAVTAYKMAFIKTYFLK